MAKEKRTDQFDPASSGTDRFPAGKEVVDTTNVPENSSEFEGTESEAIASKQAEKLKTKVKVSPQATVSVKNGVKGESAQSSAVVAADGAGAGLSPVDDRSRSPYADKQSRPDGLFGKKSNEQIALLNKSVSEQVIPEFQESKSLVDAPNEVQVYHGRPLFKGPRSRKNAGNTPHDSLYFRSADYLDHDEIVYSSGQVLDDIPGTAGYVHHTFNFESQQYEELGSKMVKSNYLLESMTITCDNGHISGIKFNETQFVPKASMSEREQANLNWKLDANYVAKSLQKLRTALGKESSDNWSPFGYAIPHASQTLMLLHDIEATTGAIGALALRSAVSGYNAQYNVIAKDGQDEVGPAVRAILEGMGEVPSPDVYKGVSLGDVLYDADRKYAQNGSIGALIRAFTSISKFKSKGDLLTHPEGLKKWIPAAMNHYKNLRVKPAFLNAVKTAHTYSTIDGEYNPALPIYRTRWIHLVNPLSLNYFLEGWVNPKIAEDLSNNDNDTGTRNILAYSFHDMRNNPCRDIKHPVVEGLLKWIIDHEASLVSAWTKDGKGTVTIPCGFNMAAPSTFAMMICASMEDINERRAFYLEDIFAAQDQMDSYVFSDLDTLTQLDPLESSQLKLNGYGNPIKLGKLTPAAAIRATWPEHFTVHGEQVGEGADFVAPWYMSDIAFAQGEYRDNNSFLTDEEDAATMSIPTVRTGVCHEYVDLIHEHSAREVRLMLDRMVTLPTYTKFYGHTTEGEYIPTRGKFVASYEDADDVRISTLKYDRYSQGRVYVTYDKKLSNAALMCVPRELGFICPSIPGLYPTIESVDSKKVTFASGIGQAKITDGVLINTLKNAFDGSTTWKLRSYAVPGHSDSGTVNDLKESIALRQVYYTYYAARAVDFVKYNKNFFKHIGFAPTISALFNAGDATINDNVAKVTGVRALQSYQDASVRVEADAEGNGEVKGVQTTSFVSLASALFGILQRVFFASNPFDNSLIVQNSEEETKAGVYLDPLEAAIYFGVSGVLSSDFSQDVLARTSEYEQLGVDYLEDRFAKDSAILRGHKAN